ncbi:hypothetical protein JD969_01710 [Planctomycetota bacterium]|nr:hypothetical protein JD969_01710 [Planctomycetota bacterium]
MMVSILSHRFTLGVLSIAYAAVLFLTITARAQQVNEEPNQVPVSTQVVELAITKNVPLEKFPFEIIFENAGTRITAIMTCEDTDYRIIEFDPQNSTITKFADNKGSDLLASYKRMPSIEGNQLMVLQSVIQSRADISEDGRHLVLDFYSPDRPAKDATEIDINAMLALRLASGSRKETFTNVPIKPGPVFDLKKYELRITDVKPVAWGNTRQVVAFSVPRNIADNIASVRILNSQGKDITGSRNSMTNLLDRTVFEYLLTDRLTNATFEFEFYDNSQLIRVPLKLKTTLGL